MRQTTRVLVKHELLQKFLGSKVFVTLRVLYDTNMVIQRRTLPGVAGISSPRAE